jgi:hypothetical protein
MENHPSQNQKWNSTKFVVHIERERERQKGVEVRFSQLLIVTIQYTSFLLLFMFFRLFAFFLPPIY